MSEDTAKKKLGTFHPISPISEGAPCVGLRKRRVEIVSGSEECLVHRLHSEKEISSGYCLHGADDAERRRSVRGAQHRAHVPPLAHRGDHKKVHSGYLIHGSEEWRDVGPGDEVAVR